MSNELSALGPRFEAALAYANLVHAGQRRKGTSIPYVAHLLGVASLVLEDGGDEDETIAALLHDAVEDGGGRPRLLDIRGRFGERVAAIVEGCSDAETVPKPPWLARKRHHLARLRHASPEVARVAAADKLHNARAVLADFRRHGPSLFDRFNGGRDGTLWYYACAVNVLRERAPGDLVDELARVVGELREAVGTGLAWPVSEEVDPASR